MGVRYWVQQKRHQTYLCCHKIIILNLKHLHLNTFAISNHAQIAHLYVKLN